MTDTNVTGLALAHRTESGSKILLVRTGSAASQWALPTTRDGETFEQLLDAIKAEVLRGGNIATLPETTKSFETKSGNQVFHFAATEADVSAYFESERFVDARWASFDEAFHIARLDHEAPIRWTERQAQKHLERT